MHTRLEKARIAALLVSPFAVFALVGCTGGAQQTGIGVSQDAAAALSVTLSADQVTQMRATCQAVAPDLAAATSPHAPTKISATAVYPKAFCDQLVAGGVPASATAATPTWFGKTLGVLQTAAQIAGMVLPLIAAL